MKANEFVKEFGIPLAEMIANESPSWAKSYFLGIEEYEGSDFSQSYEDCISIDDLKRLVESHELVEKCGGLQSVGEKLTHGLYESRAVIGRLEQAIADVESCKRLEVG